MKTQLRTIFLLLFVVSLTSQIAIAVAKKQQDDVAKEKIVNFLNNNKDFQNSSVNGFSAKFTGEFKELPDDIKIELERNFPRYKFYIAKMNVLIDPPVRLYNLVLFTDSSSNEVKGFVWGDYRMLRPTNSFSHILQGDKAMSKDNALAKVKLIARLIAFAGDVKTGNEKMKDGKISVELIRQEGISAILTANITKHLKFKSLAITEPNGKPIKYFVY